MTNKDIEDIINIICPDDADFEKTCISPAYLKKELEALAMEQEPEKKAKKQSDEVIHFEVSIDKKQLNTAIQNVAKRLIPTKPKGDYHSVPHYRCPSCNCSVKLYENSEVYPYCIYCGQALDWNEN